MTTYHADGKTKKGELDKAAAVAVLFISPHSLTTTGPKKDKKRFSTRGARAKINPRVRNLLLEEKKNINENVGKVNFS